MAEIRALVREHVAILDGMVEQLPRVLAKEVLGGGDAACVKVFSD